MRCIHRCGSYPRRWSWGLLQFGLGLRAEARGPGRGGGYSPSYRVSDYLGAPGLYGMSYGFASYGMPQTYSVFSAYPGPVLRLELSAVRDHAGPVWRRPVAAGVCRRRVMSTGLRTITRRLRSRIEPSRVGYNPGVPVNGVAPPPVGVYAPGLGPSSVYGW